MSELPHSLKCLTLAHLLDDRDTIEKLLEENPDTEKCIHTALRTMLETSDFPAIPHFSNKQLLKYLSVLWSDMLTLSEPNPKNLFTRRVVRLYNQTVNFKLKNAARQGLTYLTLYFIRLGADPRMIKKGYLDGIRSSHTFAS